MTTTLAFLPEIDNWGVMIPIVAVIAVFTFLIIATIADAIRKVAQTGAREKTKREIAAYVAEGSMSAQDAKLLMQDDTKSASSEAKKKMNKCFYPDDPHA